MLEPLFPESAQPCSQSYDFMDFILQDLIQKEELLQAK